ncbi:tRNA (adenosine(37)-N6)-threonylcarbamoyltransferase complex dimerization subunit type 1 TsaB [Neisseria sp. Ec49-e6-T10]|uniref:tRNA (adenosine(37)-N6)-threonylcarbamoyltransferase complex dimerization subunit type 1 TsaB n=1 Tax=Neisseria sp. Ec49-e6-T10 TaxID=3140744 RepID=UPI003EBDE12C
MFALSIDTSTSFLSLALQIDTKQDLVHVAAEQKHAELIFPTLKELLVKHDIQLNQLDLITYAQGPGSFTGLRIGAGVAQGLSLAHDTPLVAVPTLDVLSSLAPKHEQVLCAIDARMGEVFFAWYDTKNQKKLSDYQVGKPDSITLPMPCQSAMGIGNAFAVYDHLPVKGMVTMPTAADFLPLALSGNYPQLKAQEAELLYVRNKIALTATEQAQRKAQK